MITTIAITINQLIRIYLFSSNCRARRVRTDSWVGDFLDDVRMRLHAAKL